MSRKINILGVLLKYLVKKKYSTQTNYSIRKNALRNTKNKAKIPELKKNSKHSLLFCDGIWLMTKPTPSFRIECMPCWLYKAVESAIFFYHPSPSEALFCSTHESVYCSKLTRNCDKKMFMMEAWVRWSMRSHGQFMKLFPRSTCTNNISINDDLKIPALDNMHSIDEQSSNLHFKPIKYEASNTASAA